MKMSKWEVDGRSTLTKKKTLNKTVLQNQKTMNYVVLTDKTKDGFLKLQRNSLCVMM